MKRAFNYTNRKTIPAGAVKVTIVEDGPSGIPSFDAVLDGLKELDLSEDNRIVIEPYVGVVAMRFECGTVGAPLLPVDRRLTDIDLGGAIRFRVLVIDGEADPSRIVAAGVVGAGDDTEDESRRSILYLKETALLGERLWKLDMAGDAMPQLLINSRFPGLKNKLMTEPMIQGLVFPAVVRELISDLVGGPRSMNANGYPRGRNMRSHWWGGKCPKTMMTRSGMPSSRNASLPSVTNSDLPTLSSRE